jgi:hypothetical protein
LGIGWTQSVAVFIHIKTILEKILTVGLGAAFSAAALFNQHLPFGIKA